MDSPKTTQRKNFRCIFNNYVSEYNKDAVVRSVISQFEGYFAEPEVTVTEDGFILSLMLGSNLPASVVRDKILWNQFIESVSAADAIRKIQILRLPQSSKENEGTVGAWGPNGSDSGVNEKLDIPLDFVPKYKIDGVPDDPLGYHASVHTADPTGQMLPEIYGPGSETGEPVDEDVLSDATDLESAGGHKIPRLFNAGFRRVAIDTDVGSAFTLNKPNGFQDVNTPPETAFLDQRANPGTGIGGGAPISGASFFVYDPLNAQGTEPGAERNRGDASSAPLGNISASKVSEEDDEQGIKGPYGAELDVLGVGDEPLGGASYGSYFGINEYYDYEGDIDDYDI